MNQNRKGNTAVLNRSSGAGSSRGRQNPPYGAVPKHARTAFPRSEMYSGDNPGAYRAGSSAESALRQGRPAGGMTLPQAGRYPAQSRPAQTFTRQNRSSQYPAGQSRPAKQSAMHGDSVRRTMPPNSRSPKPPQWTKRGGAAGGYVPPQWKNRPQAYAIPVQEKSVSDALRQQSPVHRRNEMRTAVRQNTEQMRRRNRPVQFRVAPKKKRTSFKTVFRMSLLTLILYAIVMAMILAFFAGNLILHAAKNSDTVVLQYGESTSATMVKRYRSYGSVFADGEMYLCMTDIASMCELTTTGDMKEIRYMTRTVPQDIVCMTVDSTTVFINSEGVTLAAPVRLIDEKVYVPASLILNYTSGLSVTYKQSAEKVTVIRNGSKTLSGDISYEPFVFTLKAQTTSDAIDLNSLPADLRNEIEGSHGSDERDRVTADSQ